MKQRFSWLILLVAVCAVTDSAGQSPAGGKKAKKAAAASVAPKGTNFYPIVQMHFAALDKDKNGELNRGEIEALLDEPFVRGEIAAALMVLHKTKTSSKSPLTLASIMGTAGTGKNGLSEHDRLFMDYIKRIQKADRRIFAPGGPTLENLHQGGTGDCYALAALGAFLNRNPKDVEALFVPKKDGMIHVAFPGGRDLDILPLTDAEFCISGASSERSGCWPRLFEKAVGTHLLANKYSDSNKLAIAWVGGGGSPETVITLLTGHSCKSLHTERIRSNKATDEKRREALEDVRTSLRAATETRRLACGLTSGALKDDQKIPGIAHGHAYAILGYDSKTDSVTLWNPWGNKHIPKGPPGLQNGYVTQDGMFRVPLAEAVTFLNMSVESNKVSNAKLTR